MSHFAPDKRIIRAGKRKHDRDLYLVAQGPYPHPVITTESTWGLDMNPLKERTAVQSAFSGENLLELLDVLHTREDAYIGFARANSRKRTGIENLFSLTRAEVRSMLPDISAYLMEDAYITVNGFAKPAPYKVPETGLPNIWRMEKNLRCLNAVYTDLDVGRRGEAGPAGMDQSMAMQLLVDLTHAENPLPPFSITATSGRGLYALWLLRDENSEDGPIVYKNRRSFDESLALYKAINGAIYERLGCLAADNIRDASRFLRVPGSLHSRAGKKCHYKVCLHDGKPVTYTLKELAAYFDVPSEKNIPLSGAFQWQPNENPINPKKANGPKSLAAARARDLEALEQARGGWKKGRRRFSLNVYTQLLRSAGKTKKDVKAAVLAMAANCQPPYPSDNNDQPINTLINEAWRLGFIRYRTERLVHWFQVIPEEARELNLEKILPPEVQKERQLPKGGLRAKERMERQKLIRLIIEEKGMLSSREFSRELEHYDIEASFQTVNRDLEQMGYRRSPDRKRAGRPRES